jgi:hypothetical protein
MKWTEQVLKEKVNAIIEAESANRVNSVLFELPVGTYFFTDFYSLYYGSEHTPSTVTKKYILAEPAKVRLRMFGKHGISGHSAFNYYQADDKTKTQNRYGGYFYIRLDWKHIADQPKVLAAIKAWVDKVTPNFTATKEKGVITFVNKKTKEKLHCDLANQTFSRSYKKGKDRTIRYPAQFFKYVSGRALIKTLNDPKAETFNKLVDLVSKNYLQCRNFGTFLVKMFDHQHLEQYISAGVPFSFDMPFNYTDFSKDIRNKLNAYKMEYNQDVGALFCSDFSTGQTVFSQIKDCVGFETMVRLLSANIQAMNTLVNHYHYDLKTVFEYCRARKWKSGRPAGYYWQQQQDKNTASPEDTVLDNKQYFNYSTYDCVTYLRDYARMAIDVYGENYEKYPANLVEAHDETTAIHKTRQLNIDIKKFEETIDKTLEWKSKDFVVIYPKTPEEVILEGKKLRHCVGSYIQSVVRGECKVVFLRLKENLEKPFVTIEIVGGNINQARGVANSNPTYDARMALRDYAKDKKLLYRG